MASNYPNGPVYGNATYPSNYFSSPMYREIIENTVGPVKGPMQHWQNNMKPVSTYTPPKKTSYFDVNNAYKDLMNNINAAGNKPRPSTPSASYNGGSGGGYTAPDYNAIYQQALARQNELYNQQKSYVENAYASLLGKLQEGYNYGAGEVNKGADKALQEAYVNKMLTERDLPQSLSALGITGGASESTAAGLENSYGQSRSSTEEARAQSIGQLLQQLNAAKADAESQKQGSLMQLEQQRYSGLSNIDESFANQMAALAAQNSRANASVNKSFAANNETAGTTKKQASLDTNNPYYDYTYNAIRSGKPQNEIEDTLLLQGLQPEFIQSLLESFRALGGY